VIVVCIVLLIFYTVVRGNASIASPELRLSQLGIHADHCIQ
jgi:hypothetical protein